MPNKESLEYNKLIYSCEIGLSTVMINSKLKSKLKFPNIITKEDFILWLRLSVFIKLLLSKTVLKDSDLIVAIFISE